VAELVLNAALLTALLVVGVPVPACFGAAVIMVVLIGGMVGTIVIAMFMPMVAMIESLNGGGL